MQQLSSSGPYRTVVLIRTWLALGGGLAGSLGGRCTRTTDTFIRSLWWAVKLCDGVTLRSEKLNRVLFRSQISCLAFFGFVSRRIHYRAVYRRALSQEALAFGH